ncbi:MAG: actin family protein [archaeon]|nr:actin family protein [archaeon]
MFIDEVSSLVFDIGTFNARIGYSGEDSPTCVFQPIVGISGDRKYFYSENDLRYFKEDMKIENFMNKDGTIGNFDLFEKTVDNLLNETMHIDLKDHPILFVEPSLHNKEYRINITTRLFEKYNIPALYISKSAVLSAFSCGKSNCLIFDSGHSNTYAVPIHDGYALQKSLIKSNIAGNYITHLVKEKLESKKVEVIPFFRIRKKRKYEGKYIPDYLKDLKADLSFESFWKNEIYRDIKENCLITCDDSIPYNSETDTFNVTSMAQPITYDLPDGNTVELAEDRMLLIERVFNQIKNQPSFSGYHNMIIEAVNHADIEIIKELYSNIFVCGGNSSFANFPEKLQKLVMNEMKQNFKIKISTHPNSTERKFSSWTGGSILSSLGTFHQLWLSKAEYEEQGAAIIERKCS